MGRGEGTVSIHTTKDKEEDVQPHRYLTSALDGGVYQKSHPGGLSWERNRVPILEEAEWAPEMVWKL